MDLGRIRVWERRRDEQSSGWVTEQSLPAQSGQWWLGEEHLGMLSAGVPLQLALGGEELPTELRDEGAVCLCEVLAGDMAPQGPQGAEGHGAVQAAEQLGTCGRNTV